MGTTSVKNDIKTLFQIVNTFIAFAFGLLPIFWSIELMDSVYKGPTDFIFVAYFTLGFLGLSLAVLGGTGAIFEKTTILNAYSVMTGLVIVVAVVAILKGFCGEAIIFAMFYLSVMSTVMALAVVLKKQIVKELSTSAPLPISALTSK